MLTEVVGRRPDCVALGDPSRGSDSGAPPPVGHNEHRVKAVEAVEVG